MASQAETAARLIPIANNAASVFMAVLSAGEKNDFPQMSSANLPMAVPAIDEGANGGTVPLAAAPMAPAAVPVPMPAVVPIYLFGLVMIHVVPRYDSRLRT